MRKLLLIPLLLLIPALALADAAWVDTPDLIRPGKPARLVFRAEADAAITLLDSDRRPCAVVAEAAAVRDGQGQVYWDGMTAEGPLAPGDYVLFLHSGGDVAEVPLTIGEKAPAILRVDAAPECDGDWSALVETSAAGTLSLNLSTAEGEKTLLSAACPAGETSVTWDGLLDGEAVAEGSHELILRLTDATGFSATPYALTIQVRWPSFATDTVYHTPAELTGVSCGHDPCYWQLPMGKMDEDAIWAILTQPVTVLKGDQRQLIKVRAQPDAACTDYVGEVTCDSQAVHILERREDWTLIQAYSSSVSGSKVQVWALPMTGWVETGLLEERAVDQEYGIVVDKLQQRLYLFKEGKLFTTLMCSTGYPTKTDPFNETPAGEFLIVSWTGGFWSGDMYCDYALRINGGILLHEVPCFPAFDPVSGKLTDKDFANFENFLGEKASHGCVRIQRRESPEGVNMKWLWDNLNRKAYTKVIIWDELGRTLGYPDDGVTLYYNPDGGKNYHSTPTCPSVNEKYWPLTPFSYGELEDDGFASLRRCKSCAPQLRRSEIDEINRENTRER